MSWNSLPVSLRAYFGYGARFVGVYRIICLRGREGFMKLRTWCLGLALLAANEALAADKITKESFGHGGTTRAYYLYVPETVTSASPAPLVVLLHGSGRNGLTLVEPWKELAKKHGIILAGPDAIVPAGWNMGPDGPDFISSLVDIVSAQHPVDPRRVYLFGHSAGAVHGLLLALLESQYFAAAAVHAGALPPETYPYIARAARKIPLAIWVGTDDPFFPLPAVRATRDALAAQKVDVKLTELAGHRHDYYSRARSINQQAWDFLKPHTLEADPVFTKYAIYK
jgi:poly(3-hydroxybutyrate) depolymerase